MKSVTNEETTTMRSISRCLSVFNVSQGAKILMIVEASLYVSAHDLDPEVAVAPTRR